MKRLFARMAAALLCCTMILLAMPQAGLADGEFSYKVSGGYATVTGYKGSGGYVTVPSSLGGKPVTKIGEWAFRDCTSLYGVSIPAGVKRIERNAFWRCSNLTEVNLPEGLDSISFNVFSWCISLERIIIPDSVTSIGKYAFSGCSALREIHLPKNLSKLYDGAFSGCFSLDVVEIPTGVSSIGADMFANCTGLQTVILSAGVKSIHKSAFRGCSGISIVAPENSPAAKYAVKYGFNTMTVAPVTVPVPAETAPAKGKDTGGVSKQAGDTTVITGAIYCIDVDEYRCVCLEREDSDWYGFDEDTVLEGIDEKTKPGDIIEITVRQWQSGKTSVTKVKLIRSVPAKSITGKVIEISQGFVDINVKGREEEFILLEGCSKTVNWTEDFEGRTVTIKYAQVSGQNLIISITFK